MVDWNHNGERDAFDFAMDMMVIEEMERASSNKKSTYRSTSGSSDAGDGCFLVTMLFFFGIIVVGVFILGLLMAVEDGSIWLLLVLAAILVGLIYFYQKNSAQASDNIDNTNSNKPLKTETLQYQFPNNENTIISLIASITNDETTFISRLSKAVVGLRLDDWNSASIEKFSTALLEFKKAVDNYNSENHDNNKKNKSSCTFTFVNDSGEETTRVIEKTEYGGRAKLLYNDISAAIEEMGQSISEQEKRQILIEILEGLCK